MITTDLHARLSAALGPTIPVLLPEQLRDPLEAAPLDAQGRPSVTGGERGLGAYLKAHPGGYVQIEQPVPITSDGTTATYWCAVASTHASHVGAALLARAVRRALNGTPYEPGAFREVTPSQPEALAPGAWMVRATYEILTIDGDTAG